MEKKKSKKDRREKARSESSDDSRKESRSPRRRGRTSRRGKRSRSRGRRSSRGPRDQRDVECYSCGEYGHYATDCSKRKPKGTFIFALKRLNMSEEDIQNVDKIHSKFGKIPAHLVEVSGKDWEDFTKWKVRTVEEAERRRINELVALALEKKKKVGKRRSVNRTRPRQKARGPKPLAPLGRVK
jgi:hypothetical protein